MILSMTGFGRSEVTVGGASLRVEARSVNARGLELRIRLPRNCLDLESEVRGAAAEFFARGQVELGVRISGGALEPELELDLEAAARYAGAAATLQERFGLARAPSAEMLLGLPGVARLRDPEGLPAEMHAELLQAVRTACSAAREMREREGRTLDQELRGRLGRVEKSLEEIEARADEIRRGLRKRLESRLAAIGSELEIDPARFDQELFFYIERMDITEEIVRQRSHVAQFRETLELPGSVGRKLEFLLQEMGREANTIGQKTTDVSVGRVAIELKAEVERLREQAANVE